MESKFNKGDLVRTMVGSAFDVEGIVTDILAPDERVVMLWGFTEQRYQIRDTLTGEYLNVMEHTIEGFTLAKRRHRKISNKWH